MRIVFRKETVNGLVKAVQGAYKAGDAPMVRRVSALLDLSRGETVSEIARKLGISRTSVYEWLREFLVGGESGLKPPPSFEALIQAVETTLAAFQKQPHRIKSLFGRYLEQMAQPVALVA